MKREMQDWEPYEDIIHLPHHVSTKHSQMPVQDRAAQFAPFAAFTGHGEVIKETENRHVSDDMEFVEYEGDI
ncbi:MAG: hypothetical protein Q4C52_00790 [Eubacteriales bacterium]|nr:hypothetical protein [Eubacteriales bacterium]